MSSQARMRHFQAKLFSSEIPYDGRNIKTGFAHMRQTGDNTEQLKMGKIDSPEVHTYNEVHGWNSDNVLQ